MMEQFAGLIAAGMAVLVLDLVNKRQRVARAVAAGGWVLCSMALGAGMPVVAVLGSLTGTAVLVAARVGEREWKRKLAQEEA